MDLNDLYWFPLSVKCTIKLPVFHITSGSIIWIKGNFKQKVVEIIFERSQGTWHEWFKKLLPSGFFSNWKSGLGSRLVFVLEGGEIYTTSFITNRMV